MSRMLQCIIAPLLFSFYLSSPAHAGGGPASSAHLSISPACFAVGQKVTLTIMLSGVRPGERVGFSSLSTKGGGGNLGLHTADATGRVSFTIPGPTEFDWEADTWTVSAYRANGPPPYTRPGSVWLAAKASFTVAPRGKLRPTCLPAADGSAVSTPTQLVARYFSDLNARRYYAAWLLEAPCAVRFTTTNGPGAPMGSEGFQGRGAWRGNADDAIAFSRLTSARVTKVAQFHIPILARHHILAFGISGWYTFDYSGVPWANMKHKNGFHVVKLAVWQCNGRWGVEPPVWLTGSGGELNWT